MTISRGQMERQLRMGGGIMDIVPREPALLGGIKKAVKKVGKTVKKIAKSDIGKAALLYAGTAGLGALGAKLGAGVTGSGFGLLKPSNVLANLSASKAFLADKFLGPQIQDLDTGEMFRKGTKFSKALGIGGDKGGITKLATLGALSTFLTSQFGMSPEQAEETIANPESRAIYLKRYYENLNPNAAPEEVEEFVAANLSEYATGGRVGFANGDEVIEEEKLPTLKTMPEFKGDKVEPAGIMMAGPVLPPDPTQPVNPFGPKPGDFGIEEDIPIKMASNIENDKILEALFEKYLEMGLSPKDAAEKAKEEFERMSMGRIEETRTIAAIGGKMDTASDNAMQAAGIEGLPIRQNPKGVKELDLRNTGGFIPPVGIKEKEDDIPAMLSNNEFVFTADAVRGAGDGDINLGAQRMYDTMKMLEAGGKV